MAQPLEQTFREIAEKHNFSVVDFGMNMAQRPEARFGCTLHWNGFARGGIPCVNGHGPNIQKAFANAFAAAVADRNPGLPALPETELALEAVQVPT